LHAVATVAVLTAEQRRPGVKASRDDVVNSFCKNLCGGFRTPLSFDRNDRYGISDVLSRIADAPFNLYKQSGRAAGALRVTLQVAAAAA
jgi:hypothetical protein